MAELAFTLTAAPVLGGFDERFGNNRIVERDDLAIVSVAVPHGGEAPLSGALMESWGLSIPDPIVSSENAGTRAIRTAPDQLMLVFPFDGVNADGKVQAKLNGAGYTTDQTDVWVVIEIEGPDTLAALERLCPLDIGRFPDGGAGRTVMEHMGAMVVRLGNDRFLLLSASSSARSFLHAIETSYRYVATD